jgi:hypothetical protein
MQQQQRPGQISKKTTNAIICGTTIKITDEDNEVKLLLKTIY